MEHDSLKLTSYFGERDRAGGRLLADALLDLYERRGFQTSVLLRGAEGFGLKHHLHTERLLSLSEDLPIVAVAVDTRARIAGAVQEIAGFENDGLITLERARMWSGSLEDPRLPDDLRDEAKLTVYCGRGERSADGRPAFLALVDLLHRRGLAGATVLLGVDGTARGTRRRAGFLARNADVPVMVICVGSGERLAEVLPHIGRLLEQPLLTLERVTLCKRDGERLRAPPELPERDEGGFGLWQKLMVYSGEQDRVEGRPLYSEVIRRLRRAGASGATALRGIWGYHGDHSPHGEQALALRRRVPVVTVVVDRPARIRRWFEIVDEATESSGLVTAEVVPAVRAAAPESRTGGLDLAHLRW